MRAIANRQQAQAWNDWEGIHWAEHSERYDAMMGSFNAPLFAAAGIAAGDRVLDVGCGTGQTTRIAARQAYDGDVVGIDLSAPMLDRARRDAAAEGIGNVTFEQGDAQVHPLSGRGFDVVLSRGGVMFFADHIAAFTHLRHSLVPAGRLAFLGPQPAGPDSAYARATAALSPFLREASPAARGMGSLLDPARIRQMLTASGFTDIDVAPAEAPMTFGADAGDATDFILAMGPVRYNLRDVDPGTTARIRSEVRDALAEFETIDGVRIPGHVWIVTASPGSTPTAASPETPRSTEA
ncbi:class I SAM-dependent methyltransferase [Streptomyces sp. NPDC002917]|uniref:class I SAM-dependent methyltransferase n=1 Tax=unclassified Streptomyces TaxID=2593676 RepID=UPI002E813FF1|nr:class I SAM-dependent methyltransferase [Streptomyces sp. NBC_00562]WTD38197.1 class I SAM-dependent methyltransferase [Streptomyces sp. NBC_01643]WUC24531.1 class I SAM-dependent methyltransferase [Streptomyces sp. NBC_00562]